MGSLSKLQLIFADLRFLLFHYSDIFNFAGDIC